MSTLTRFPLDSTHLQGSFVTQGKPTLPLEFHQPGWDALERALCPIEARPARVVSFLGSTHSGKSFLGSQLLGQYQHDTDPVMGNGWGLIFFFPAFLSFSNLAETVFYPTTGDTRWFCGTQQGLRSIVVLDMEGGGGGDVLPAEIAEMNFANEDARIHYCGLRRQATAEHLPRLAYAVSDVIVFVTTLGLSDHHTVEQLKAVAESCTEGVRTGTRPFLVVVSNKLADLVSEHWLANQEKQLADWKKVHSAERNLLPFFEGVQIIQMPLRKSAVFDQASLMFTRTVEGFLDARTQWREDARIRMTNKSWVRLLYNVLLEFHKTKALQVDEIFLQCVLLDDAEKGGALTRVVDLYNITKTRLSPLEMREFLCRAFALFHAETVCKNRKDLPNLADHLVRIQQDWMKSREFQQFMAFLVDNWPCMAERNGCQCELSRFNHLNQPHFSEASATESNATTAFGKKFMSLVKRGLRKVVGKTVAQWDGPFESQDPEKIVSADQMSDLCVRDYILTTLKAVTQKNGLYDATLIALARFAIFQKLSPCDDRVLTFDMNLSDLCLFCMGRSDTQLSVCHHRVCFACETALKSFNEHPIEFFGVQIMDPTILKCLLDVLLLRCYQQKIFTEDEMELHGIQKAKWMAPVGNSPGARALPPSPAKTPVKAKHSPKQPVKGLIPRKVAPKATAAPCLKCMSTSNPMEARFCNSCGNSLK